MTARGERALLQAAVAIVCIVPLTVSTLGIMRGAVWLQPAPATDLDSHFRYLSGIFLVMGIAFLTCIPAIESRTARFRLLGAMVVGGGLARLVSLAGVGVPSPGHVLGLGIELIVVPLLMLWQARVARRYRHAAAT